MKVKELLETKGIEIISMEASSSVEDAIHLMHGKKISAVIVTENSKPVGIFTERDVVRCYIANGGRKFSDIQIKEGMTTDLMVAEVDDDLNNVMSVMVEKNIRHLPVVEKDHIVGMLSIRDIVLSQVHKMKTEIHYLKDYISGY